MEVRLTHPEHGATVVHSQGDIERLQALGWSTEGDASPAPEKTPVAQSDAPAKPAKKTVKAK